MARLLAEREPFELPLLETLCISRSGAMLGALLKASLPRLRTLLLRNVVANSSMIQRLVSANVPLLAHATVFTSKP